METTAKQIEILENNTRGLDAEDQAMADAVIADLKGLATTEAERDNLQELQREQAEELAELRAEVKRLREPCDVHCPACGERLYIMAPRRSAEQARGVDGLQASTELIEDIPGGGS